MNRPLHCVLIFFPLAATALSLAGEPSGEQIEFFERSVRPLLAEHCFECHSARATRLEGGLLLDSRRGVLTGGDSGPAIAPGKPDESLLMEAVRWESYEMPPSGRLPQRQVDTLARWIEMGAPWPAGDDPSGEPKPKGFDWQERKAEHWAWQPIQPVTPPKVPSPTWPRGAIDQFLLSAMEQHGLQPAPPADRRTLIRRLHFDLIGLPPAPERVERFVADTSPRAYETLVDELLASEHFGEKWARHWMDLVRYAETHGHEFDYPIHYAYRYRDYLIRAFNQDVPYDQFITEHLAGDLMPHPRLHPIEGFNESVIGTGFWFLGEAVHAPTDVRGDEVIRIDNQIDVMSKTFLGLSVACARCHDHKFDPIPTEDYYALAGFLQSSCRQEAMLDRGHRIHDAAARLRALRRDGDALLCETIAHASLDGQTFAARLVESQDLNSPAPAGAGSASHERWAVALSDPELERPTHPLYAWRKLTSFPDTQGSWIQQQEKLTRELSKLEQKAAEARSNAVLFEDFDSNALQEWRTTGEAFDHAPTPSGQWDSTAPSDRLVEPGLMHSGLTGRKLQGVLRSPTFPLTHSKIHYRLKSQGVQIRLIIDGYFMDVFNGLLFKGVTLNDVDSKGEFAWQTQGGDIGNHIGRTAHIEVIDQGHGFAALDEIWFSDAGAPPDPPHPCNLQVSSEAETDEGLAAAYGRYWDQCRSRLEDGSAGADEIAMINWALQHGLLSDRQGVTADLAAQQQSLDDGLPTPDRVLAITDGSGEDAPVHIRGSHKNLGEVVPRRLLVAIGGESQPPITRGSGRLELARRITDPSNPFPSRVMVNRLWHHLFGRGIVATVDDFGKMGQPPSHPALLDWLAADFMQHGWSVKHTIRQIVTSSAYRMSSRADESAVQHDPSNQWLHHMPIRRLNGEAIRDAMLAVSGRLDRKMYGPSVPIHLTAFMEGRGRPASGPLDGNGRRSVYIEVRRNFLSPMMLAFDMPTPFSTMGRRSVSNVPAQSLILMNDPFVIEQARLWAERAKASNSDAKERIDSLFQQAFAHPPSDEQRNRALRFLEEQAALYDADSEDLRVWTDLCHTLFNMKEFIYLY